MEITKYSLITRTMHWVSAAVIIWATISGIYAAQLTVDNELKHLISFINVSLTTLFIPVFLFRLVYTYGKKIRSTQVIQPATQGHNVAKFFHHLMYSLISMILITGVVMMDRPIDVFGWLMVPQLINDSELNHIFRFLHKYLCQVLAAIVMLHIFAVIKHELSGIRTLKRMI